MSSGIKNLSILLVEDHKELAQIVLEYLEKEGALVEYAGNSKLAKTLLKEQHFDLILLDIMLPGEDGYSICQYLRKELTLTTPVIFTTARDHLDDKLEGFSRGGDDYIVKPFELPELLARITALIRRDRGEVADNVLKVSDLENRYGTARSTTPRQYYKNVPNSF